MSVSESYVADITDGLLREYLHKLGCKRTLQAFDEERPRHENSISSRTVLRKTLGLDRLAARLKKKKPDLSLPPTIEMWVSSQLELVKESDAGKSPVPTAKQESPRPKGWNAEPPAEESVPEAIAPRRTARPSPMGQQPTPGKTPAFLDSEGAHLGKPKTGFSTGDDAALLDQLGRSGSQVPRSMRRQQPEMDSGKEANRQTRAAQEALMMEDIDDMDMDMGGVPMPTSMGGSRRVAAGFSGTSLSPEQVRNIRELLWGSSRAPPLSWKQGFFFNPSPGLSYGLVQKEGGPCGVLAAVQAYIMESSYDGERFEISLSRSKQVQLLCKALTTVLWQAGSKRKVVLVACGEGSTSKLSYEALGRSALSKTITSEERVEEEVTASISQYMEPDGFGLVLFLFSLVLTRGLDNIRDDMDVPDNALMGAHGYCTQELVNLIITGRAISNVFDGDKQLDKDTLLKGIKGRGKVGLLTLFEWYKYVEVGSHLKSPITPVWVVCSESHFTCLFAGSRGAIDSRPPFDIFFYDGLANQDAPLRLSITQSPTGGHTAKAGETIGDRGNREGDLVPPLEYVIETRWPGVAVNWNGSEPIL